VITELTNFCVSCVIELVELLFDLYETPAKMEAKYSTTDKVTLPPAALFDEGNVTEILLNESGRDKTYDGLVALDVALGIERRAIDNLMESVATEMSFKSDASDELLTTPDDDAEANSFEMRSATNDSVLPTATDEEFVAWVPLFPPHVRHGKRIRSVGRDVG
jgi:hypothetical protein